MRLSRSTLSHVPTEIAAPRGRRDGPVGIVHFGPGAFHRAHQAVFVDALLDQDPRWGIAAVSMRSRTTIDALAAQDGLYTIAIRDAEPSFRVIGAHRRFLGPAENSATRVLLADPAVRLVTTTVTEKGYCLAPDGSLDLSHPDVVHDLAGTDVPATVIGWIVEGLAARRANGAAPFVVMPCDNLADNGAKLKAALVAFARVRDGALADWIAGEVAVPATMVDAITPAADEELTGRVAAALDGLVDAVPVQREAFAQWVIEDTGRPLGPDLASVGATITRDVGGHERAKLRILNGAHSTLAYLGLLRGHATVFEAMADAALADFVAGMIAADVVPMLTPVGGLNLAEYARAVLARFRNPAIVHRLEQIAQDGSQKLPYRLGDTLLANRARGRLPAHVLTAFGGWIAFLIDRARTGTPIVDPAGGALASIAASGDARRIAATLAARGLGLPSDLCTDEAALDAIARATTQAVAGDWSILEPGC